MESRGGGAEVALAVPRDSSGPGAAGPPGASGDADARRTAALAPRRAVGRGRLRRLGGGRPAGHGRAPRSGAGRELRPGPLSVADERGGGPAAAPAGRAFRGGGRPARLRGAAGDAAVRLSPGLARTL